MQNPVLDRHLIDCKELAVVWKKFLDLFNASIRGGDSLNPDNEQLFLECKSRIAMVHDSFMDSLKHDQQIGQNIYGIITRCITMRHVHKMSSAETKKIEIEWHESFLLLNETVTTLEEERDKLAQVNPTAYHIQRFMANFKANMKAFFGSRLFKLAIGLFAFLFILFGIPMFGIYDYDNLRKVDGVNKVYYQWMNVKRLFIGGTPFGTKSDFMTKYLPGNAAPQGYAYGPEDRKPKKDTVANYFARVTLENGKNMATALQAAQDFEGVRLDQIAGSRANVNVAAFWFFSNSDAQEIARLYNKFAQQFTSAPYTVFAVNNVLVVLESGEAPLRQGLATGTFGQKAY